MLINRGGGGSGGSTQLALALSPGRRGHQAHRRPALAEEGARIWAGAENPWPRALAANVGRPLPAHPAAGMVPGHQGEKARGQPRPMLASAAVFVQPPALARTGAGQALRLHKVLAALRVRVLLLGLHLSGPVGLRVPHG